MQTHQVGLVLFDNCELLDVTGPACVFNFAARIAHNRHGVSPPLYETRYYSPDGGMVRTIEAACIDTAPLTELHGHGAQTLIISGGPTTYALKQTAISDWLLSHAQEFERIGSVCTGGYLMAQAGLLDGRRAACHWDDWDEMAAQHPTVLIDRDALFANDGGYWTSAGASSGIDMALAMVEEDVGHQLVFEIAKEMVVFLKRDSRGPQVSTLLQSQSNPGRLDDLLVWVASNPAANLSVEELASRANMSVRTFYRNFERQTNMAPGEWVERTRVEAAQRLLEQSDRRVEQVAVEVGFGSCERMRRAFVRSMGASPAAYRQKYFATNRHPPEGCGPAGQIPT